jgi:hypothetical protein
MTYWMPRAGRALNALIALKFQFAYFHACARFLIGSALIALKFKLGMSGIAVTGSVQSVHSVRSRRRGGALTVRCGPAGEPDLLHFPLVHERL